MGSTSASRGTASIPDDILEDIFLRLDAAADLVRVSATCSTFRRIVSARRFRSLLHSPPVLGFLRYGRRDFLPVDPPHRSAAEARALVQAADFAFSFLPDPDAWLTQDARDGRVLLSRHISARIQLREFAVCDPLHRRYVKIPHIPDDLLPASTACNATHLYPLTPVLAPAAENDGEESFRVIRTVKLEEDKLMALVFSSCTQAWRGIISTVAMPCVPDRFLGHTPYYGHGCVYWMISAWGYSLMLDTTEMKFSIIDLPPHDFLSHRAIVGAADGRLGFLTIGAGKVDLYSRARQSNGAGAQEWRHDKQIPLPIESGIDYIWNIVGTAGRYVAFRANCYEIQNYEYFVLDVKTQLVEKLCTSKNGWSVPYARFPPPLALPSI